jgi:HD-GYP domain-containing protein (c-di-GMP phosphodiesterase class II)
MRPVAGMVRSSHERWDGTGYPDGIPAADVPLGSRVIFICDAYDAMTNVRAYRPRLSPDEALAELRRNAGTQFDPALVELFAEIAADGTAAPPQTAAARP